MPPADYPANFLVRVKGMQIIVVALVIGSAIFLGVTLFQRSGLAFNAETRPTPYLTYVALGVALLLLIGHYILPAMLVEAARRKVAQPQGPAPLGGSESDAGKLLTLFQTRLIIGAALVEAAAFLVITAFLVEGFLQDYAGWLAPLGLIAFLAFQYPTQPKVESWIEEQRKLLAEDRRSAGTA